MSDYSELKAAAETVKQAFSALCEHGGDELAEAWKLAEIAYDDATNPDVVLGLIAENERMTKIAYAAHGAFRMETLAERDQLKTENEALKSQVQVLQANPNSWQSGYDEGRRMGTKHRADEVERLKAENAGLQTGYKAYEQVNAELRVEVEALRKDAERYQWMSTEGNWVARFHGKWRAHVGEYGDKNPTDWYPSRDEAIDAAMAQGEQP